jgi:hypothetical protein
MALKVEVIDDATPGLRELSRNAERLVREAQENSSKELEREARTVHRYRIRSGLLERATKSEIVQSAINLYIDNGLADYGKYVHEGTNKRPPDRFVYQAMERKEDSIRDKIETAFDKAITAAGF